MAYLLSMDLDLVKFFKLHAQRILWILLLLLVLVFFFHRWYAGSSVVVFEVKAKNFVQSVVASGQVQNPHRIDVGVQITGTVSNIPVQEGQDVNKGDVLIELESTELRAALRQAQLNVELARVKLLQLLVSKERRS